MSVEKNMVADLAEEAILAATYVPENEEEYSDNSGSSADFEGQVNQIIGDNVESSTRRENLGMAECEYSVNPMKSHSLFTIHSEGTSSGKPMTTMVPGNNLENQDINLKELLNPCEMMKAQRTERRTSERIQEDIKKTMGNSSQKRSLQGLYGSEIQDKIVEGAKILLACAHRVLAQQPRPVIYLPAPTEDLSDEEEDA
ncbi:uncharacterized protein LOC120658616 [Panicum virgatum]|uniref:Uncharacterized protein n=1 Tax=Panicum virgatum TaxID=38727 RepID=A0A8T0VSQ0_PANVG|nr:uncharacterized protein LOC120658616 [Panicum virgatum]XP_039792822.1 uncharacterized protein LOC120658616 [Panicum virgatum]KAG2638230.1 hypothetical protein PVAP13_2NG475260 [Panicum virgatum]